jgi:hypothetical protein
VDTRMKLTATQRTILERLAAGDVLTRTHIRGRLPRVVWRDASPQKAIRWPIAFALEERGLIGRVCGQDGGWNYDITQAGRVVLAL